MSERVAILALGSFQHYAESLMPILLKFLEDTHWSVREAAVTALGLLQTDQVEAELFEMLGDPDMTVPKGIAGHNGTYRVTRSDSDPDRTSCRRRTG